MYFTLHIGIIDWLDRLSCSLDSISFFKYSYPTCLIVIIAKPSPWGFIDREPSHSSFLWFQMYIDRPKMIELHNIITSSSLLNLTFASFQMPELGEYLSNCPWFTLINLYNILPLWPKCHIQLSSYYNRLFIRPVVNRRCLYNSYRQWLLTFHTNIEFWTIWFVS